MVWVVVEPHQQRKWPGFLAILANDKAYYSTMDYIDWISQRQQ
jgi:hypothetical protein